MAELEQILAAAIQYDISDVLLVPGAPPMIRMDGLLQPLPEAAVLTPAECKHLIYSMLHDSQRARFEKSGELDCAYRFKETRNFRVNVYVQRLGVAAALRVIPERIPTPEQIGLSPAILALTDLPRGLVLVTGTTGSGKSTTLAAMIQHVNMHKRKHILTIEDPIEFVYKNEKSVIDQREVGHHTVSFAQALKYALRQNPDIIMIGEMRDLETMELAIKASETGHLCLSTLHTQDAPSTINRIISEFPGEQRDKLCTQLASVVKGVICQTLLPRVDGSRVCARETMLMNAAISTLIRDNKVHLISNTIESGLADGMCTMDQSLAFLVQRKMVDFEEALARAQSPKNFRALLAAGFSNSKPVMNAPAHPVPPGQKA